jgi:hypothetical protein
VRFRGDQRQLSFLRVPLIGSPRRLFLFAKEGGSTLIEPSMADFWFSSSELGGFVGSCVSGISSPCVLNSEGELFMAFCFLFFTILQSPGKNSVANFPMSPEDIPGAKRQMLRRAYYYLQARWDLVLGAEDGDCLLLHHHIGLDQASHIATLADDFGLK